MNLLRNMRQPALKRFVRDTLCVVLVAALLFPSAAVAQAPQFPVPPEPRAPAAPGQAAPPQQLPALPSPDFPVRAPGGAALQRQDPCAQFGSGTANFRVPSTEYRLGAGDVLDVQIAGRFEVSRQQAVIDPEGLVSIPPVGTVDVGGLTLRAANRRIGEQVRNMLRHGNVTLSIMVPRCFEVVLSGEVERPGSIHTSAMRRLHEVLLDAGGVTPRGSLRKVTVTRDDQVTELDMLRFELDGDLTQNPTAEAGMRIHVPPRGGTVSLTGAFRRPGDYEIDAAGSLKELLALTGGLAQNAAPTEGRLTRLGSEGRKETVAVDLTTALVTPGDVPLRTGDVLFVPQLVVLQDVIEVRGAFIGNPESSRTTTAGRPTIVQRLELAKGDRIKDVVGRAGGAAAFADLRLAFVERTGVAGPRQRIPIDLRQILVAKDDTQNIVLENGDVLNLPVAEDKVYVLGEVKTPGGIDFRPDLTPREYLALAGGPTVRARFRNATVTFPDGKSYALALAPPLEAGAVVTVPEVSVRWYQDYLSIASTLANLITSYTALYFLFKD
jgi:protein involved in polysaccharide export with SLBB domain